MINLHLGDCLEFMRTLESGSVDAVITDPPYGINLDTANADNARGKLALANNYPRIHGDDKPFDPSPFLDFPTVVLFGANHYADKLPSSSHWFVWDKRDGIPSNDQADCELAWCNLGKTARLYRHLWNGMIKASERTHRRIHPTQKPVALMEWILLQVTQEGDTVFDPFMGSGTTGVACVKLGRNFIGCEINPDYYKIAERRIAEAQLQMPLDMAFEKA